MLKDPAEIRAAYSGTHTAEEYIDKRFASAWGSVMHAAQVTALNDVIRRHHVQTLLELAPGPARISAELSGFAHGYLCEFNESMVRVARRRLADDTRWKIVRGDAFRLPFRRPLALDMVYTFRFIRHFEAPDRAALYEQIRSVLKDGGLFVFDAVNVDVGLPAREKDGLDKNPIHDVFYRPDELNRELQQHGFVPMATVDVIRHLRLQHWIQILVAPRSHGLARSLIASLEHIPGSPLEWVVVCRKA